MSSEIDSREPLTVARGGDCGSSRDAAASRFDSHPVWLRSAADAEATGIG